MSLSVNIIGSGNLACHLAKALFERGVRVKQVYSRNIIHATALADQVNAEPISDYSAIHPVDVLFICVTDSAIQEVAESLPISSSLVVHTSGSTSIDVLTNHPNFGVFYPFQTFSKDKEVKFDEIPVMVEANNNANLQLLKTLASLVSHNVIENSSAQRLKLHLAAVFACNFANHMYAVSKEILDEAGLSFGSLKQLIEETAHKAIDSDNPAEVQTGPAVRQNMAILEKHKELLAEKPLWQKIYTFVSESIIEMKERM